MQYFIYTVIILLPLIYCPVTYDMFNFPKEIFFKLVIILSFLYFIILKKEFRLRKSILNLPIILFFIFSLLSGVNVTNLLLFYNRIYLLIFIILFYVILIEANICYQKLFKLSFIAAFTLSIICILQYFNIDLTGINRISNVPVNFLYTTLGHRNYLSEYLSMVAPLTLVFAISKNKAYFILFLLFLFTIFLTESRAGILSVILSILFFIIYYVKVNRKIFLLIIPLVLLIILFSIPNPLIKQSLIQRIFSTGSVLERMVIWQVGMKMIRENMLTGVGLNNISSCYSTYYKKFDVAKKKKILNLKFPVYKTNYLHNEYLNITAEGGILSLYCMLWIIIIVFKKGGQYLKEREYLFKLGLLASFISLIITSFFSFPLHHLTTLTYGILIIMGIVER